jgi:hypothetical protein
MGTKGQRSGTLSQQKDERGQSSKMNKITKVTGGGGLAKGRWDLKRVVQRWERAVQRTAGVSCAGEILHCKGGAAAVSDLGGKRTFTGFLNGCHG